MSNETDTCRKYMLPKLVDAYWDNKPHSFTAQRTFKIEGRHPGRYVHLHLQNQQYFRTIRTKQHLSTVPGPPSVNLAEPIIKLIFFRIV